MYPTHCRTRRHLAVLLPAALAIATLLPAAALAGPGRPHRGPAMRERFRERIFDRLGLTEQQRDSVEAIAQKSREQLQPTMEQLRTARDTLFDRIHAAEPDDSAIRAASAQVATLQADLAVARAHRLQEIRAVLTPEQRTQLDTLQTQMKQRRQRRAGEPWERGSGMPMPPPEDEGL